MRMSLRCGGGRREGRLYVTACRMSKPISQRCLPASPSCFCFPIELVPSLPPPVLLLAVDSLSPLPVGCARYAGRHVELKRRKLSHPLF